MTFTLVEMLMILMTLAVTIGVVMFIRLAGQVMETARQVEAAARAVEDLTPSVRRAVDEGAEEIAKLQAITAKTSQIASEIHTVTEAASEVSAQFARGFGGQVAGYRALFAGARAGFDVLRHARGKDRVRSAGGQSAGNGSTDNEVEDLEYVRQ